MNKILLYIINSLENYGFSFNIFKRIKFKIFVSQIMLEISSACNRKCIYCPHSLTVREKKIMNNETFNHILSELASIRYKNHICLNIYNEPLFYYDDLLKKIHKIKKILPKAHVFFSTNGDLLTKNRLKELEDSGLDSLIITEHPINAFEWKVDEIKKCIQDRAEKWQLPPGEWNIVPNSSVNYTTMQGKMPVKIFSLNFPSVGNNRGGVLSTVETPEDFRRVSPCQRVIQDLSISYDGSVYPCCQFFHGLDKNLVYCIGNTNKNSIFDIFFNKKMCTFRTMASSPKPKVFPCSTCRE